MWFYNKKNNIVLLGFTLPDNIMTSSIEHDKFPAFQTQKFSKSLKNVFDNLDGFDVSYISTRPITLYPNNKKIFIKRNVFKQDKITELSFINFFGFKLLSRFFSSFFELIFDVLLNKRSFIVVYSVHLPFMLSGFLVSKIFGCELIGVWTDPPAKSVSKNIFVRFIRGIEFFISLHVMKKFDKTIVLSKHLSLDYNSNSPYFVMEGIVDDSMNFFQENYKNSLVKYPVRIVYTGSIEVDYGIDSLIKAAEIFPENLISLELYGTGSYLKNINDDIYKNVTIKGVVSPNEIPQILSDADILINCRDPNLDFTKYSFPSKTIEYLCTGTPVIMTKLSGIPDEYYDFVTTSVSSDHLDIKNAIDYVLINYDLCMDNSSRAKRFILTNKNYKSWAIKISNFLIN